VFRAATSKHRHKTLRAACDLDLSKQRIDLGTARGAYDVWYVVIPKDLSPRIRVDVFGASISLFAEGLDFVWTAGYGDTTEISIATALYEFNSKRRQAFDI